MTVSVVWHSVLETVAWWLYAGGVLLALAMVPVVLSSERVSQAKVAWILGIVGFPWFGALLYATLGRRHVPRRAVRIRAARAPALKSVDEGFRRSGVYARPSAAPPGASDPAADLVAVGASPPVEGNAFDLLVEGEDAFAMARAAIERAKRHVHLTTYIFRADVTGRGTVAVLADAAKRGVEVRVLFDGLGAFRTHRRFFEPIVDAGGRVSAFLPFRSFFRVNTRNHRKLLVVDGEVAFTGGLNVGDEYRDGRTWRDVHARVSGPVVALLQRVFAEDWLFATEEVLDDDRYYPSVAPAGDVPVQVLASGPDQNDPLAEQAFFAAAVAARRSVDVVTPYVVPTEPVEEALRSAAKRGRRVRLLTGEFVDHRLVRWATDAHLPRLVEAGVEVYRRPGMVHGKVLVVDRAWATLGSANLDARSLRLNFELNVAFPHAPSAERLARYVDAEIATAKRLEAADFECGAATRFARSAATLFSPVL